MPRHTEKGWKTHRQASLAFALGLLLLRMQTWVFLLFPSLGVSTLGVLPSIKCPWAIHATLSPLKNLQFPPYRCPTCTLPTQRVPIHTLLTQWVSSLNPSHLVPSRPSASPYPMQRLSVLHTRGVILPSCRGVSWGLQADSAFAEVLQGYQVMGCGSRWVPSENSLLLRIFLNKETSVQSSQC